jgi:hypothetical protein
MVSVLATGPNVHDFETGRGDAFLREMIICSTPSFRAEVKPSTSYRKIIRHVKNNSEV